VAQAQCTAGSALRATEGTTVVDLRVLGDMVLRRNIMLENIWQANDACTDLGC
jgi:hypothetical protein